MSFVDLKARSRRSVHAIFAVPCTLANGEGSFALTARLHGRMVVGGDLESQGYAMTLEGVFRVVFNREELATAGVSPRRGDKVTFVNYVGPGQDMGVELDARDEYDGPINEKWSVAHFTLTSASTGVAFGGGSMETIEP